MVVTEDYKRYPRTGKRGAPQVFPRKLFELLEKEDSAVIRWDEEGECFVIQVRPGRSACRRGGPAAGLNGLSAPPGYGHVHARESRALL